MTEVSSTQKAPERIWAIPLDEGRDHDFRNAWIVMQPEDGAVEFVRADLADTAAIKVAVDMMADQHGWVRRDAADTAAWNAAIRAAAGKFRAETEYLLLSGDIDDIEHAILALIQKGADR